jgi:hypothetical protein
MSIAGISVSLFALVAGVAAILAVATVWLMLANPAGVADAVNSGSITPLVTELARTLVGALTGLLRYL